MSSYKDPGFQERTALAQQAKQKALDQLRARPALDETVLAERSAARHAREEAEAALRLAKLADREQAKADKRALADARALEAAAAAQVAATRAVATEAEKKAARDARYAARKKGSPSR